VDDGMTCDNCFGEFKGRKGFRLFREGWLCTTCAAYADRWDAMTPGERHAEMESMMIHSAEVDRA
jgi:hypothetical protein